jgi:hypothetical protein
MTKLKRHLIFFITITNKTKKTILKTKNKYKKTKN